MLYFYLWVFLWGSPLYKEILRDIRNKNKKTRKICVIYNILVCQCGWPHNQGIVMVRVPKENVDVLVGASKIMVSLGPVKFWTCPVLPLKEMQRLKIQDSGREPSQKALILLPKKREGRKKSITNLLVGICLHKTQLFSYNCKNAHDVWIKADIPLLYWPHLEEIQGINVFLKISNWPLIIIEFEVEFSAKGSVGYNFIFLHLSTSGSKMLHAVVIGYRKANLWRSIAWKWNILNVQI